MQLKDLKTIYFLGIGGIGMSALARYFNGLGAKVSGYDKVCTALTQQLEEEGMQIYYDESVEHIPNDVDLIIWTPAIPKTHKELMHIRQYPERYILKKRAEVLGIISKSKKVIGVAGTHGKTTTSSLLTHILRTAGVDCTAFLGGIAANFNSNFIQGKSDWVVIEADEFDRSFLHLYPEVAILTSMDADHLDIYGEHDEMKATFKQYVSQVRDAVFYQYKLGVNFDKTPAHLNTWVDYGLGDATTIHTNNIQVAPKPTFDFNGQAIISNIEYKLAGLHNIENTTAAIAVALHLGCLPEKIAEGVETFKGIQRRFEYVYQDEQVVYIDDYAHHPEELNAAIGAVRHLYPNRRVVGVFQPHLFSRTQDFADGFAEALAALDEILLLEIYPARELPIDGVNSTMLLDKIEHDHKHLLTKEELLQYVSNTDLDVFLTLGAGDIGAMVPAIAKRLSEKHESIEHESTS